MILCATCGGKATGGVCWECGKFQQECSCRLKWRPPRCTGCGECHDGACPDGNDSTLPDLPDVSLRTIAEAGIKPPELIAGGMLYCGGVHCLAGQPGGGKTTLMAWWMLQHIRDGGNVLLLDEESGAEMIAEKFLDLGAALDELTPPRFSYIPFPCRGWNLTDIRQLKARIGERQPGIIAWDSVAAFLAIAGKDENLAADVTSFWNKVLMPCARESGAAVIAADHTGKGDHNGYGRGSGAKKAASDVQFITETVRPFNRWQDGVIRLTTAPGKDRRGWLAAGWEVHVKAGPPLALDITEAAPPRPGRNGTDNWPPAKSKLFEALATIATQADPLSVSQLVDWIVIKHGHGLKRPTCSTHLNELAAEGLADAVDLGIGKEKLWFPLTRTP